MLSPQIAAMRAANTIHGHRYSPTYSSWSSMLKRCHNPNDASYPRYGGLGVAVCDQWRSDFRTFLADMGERPAGTSIDRIDGARGYEPGNCRWATASQQNRNRCCALIVDTPSGRHALIDYAATIGLTLGAARLRVKKGKLEGVSFVKRDAH